MNLNFLRILIISSMMLSVASCGDDELAPIEIKAESFVMSMDENPVEGLVLGDIEATANRGLLIYEIMSQDPVGALVLEPIKGRLSVGDASAFDFEEREYITAMIIVSSEDKEEAIVARINLSDIEE